MNFFTSGTFWFIEGIILCLIIIGLKLWTEDKKIKMSFLKWMLFLIWFFFFEFTIAFITTSLGENEIQAALKGGILFMIIALISFVLVWRIIKYGFKGLFESHK